jgi:hypothetical protein
MTEQDGNNPIVGGQEANEKLDDEFIPADAQPLCLKCLKPCHPLQNYCDNCDSNQVINPLASYMPFVNIRFNYDIYLTMWRKVWYDSKTSIVSRLFYLFMIAAFMPMLVMFGLPALLISSSNRPRLRKTAIIALYIIAMLLLFIVFFLPRIFSWRLP